VLTFREVSKRQDNVYSLTQGVDWNYVEEELRKAGINKSSERIRNLYRQICKHPESGVESLRNYRWRKHWSLICHIKTFLEGKGLVADPEDENDN